MMKPQSSLASAGHVARNISGTGLVVDQVAESGTTYLVGRTAPVQTSRGVLRIAAWKMMDAEARNIWPTSTRLTATLAERHLVEPSAPRTTRGAGRHRRQPHARVRRDAAGIENPAPSSGMFQVDDSYNERDARSLRFNQ